MRNKMPGHYLLFFLRLNHFCLKLLCCCFTKKRYSRQTRLEGIQRLLRLAAALVHMHGEPTVQICAGNLFKQRSALISACLQKGGKTALGQEHGPGELLKVHPRYRFNLL